MPNPLPDPNGRPSSVPPAPEAASGHSPEPVTPAPNSKGSTGSHYPTPAAEPLSDLLRKAGSSARRVPKTGSDLLQMLGNPGASPIKAGGSNPPENPDDAPTIITRNHGVPSPPLALPVSGDAPSIAGRRLGHFELIESIGAGGMAAVLKARDLELGRVVALKILPPEAARDHEGVSRFKQEARAAAMLDHQNVARVYFCGEDQGLHFIAFEFVEGENLRQLIDRRGTIPPAECVRYMIQVAAGLSHAAERGVVHRDIKPSNIIITPDGRAKIVDMGLARHLDAVNGGVTHSGVTLGTFDYISPEQALDPRRADVRSDIYSLGCAFYHALTGRPPVPEGTAAKKLRAHQHIDPLDPREINPTIPDDLAAILSGMMAKNPDQRYQTPADLIAHLKGVAERMKLSLDMLASDSTVQSVPASLAIAAEPPRLRFGWMVAVAAVAIVLIAFAISSDRDPHPAPPTWALNPPGQIIDPPINLGPNGKQSPGEPADGVVAVSTVKALALALADPRTHRVHLDAGTYDLSELPTGIVNSESKGGELQLIGSSAGVTRMVLFASPALAANGSDPSGTLTIKAERLSISGIRFEIHSPVASGEQFPLDGPVAHSAGLSIRSTTQAPAQVHLTDCVFTSNSPVEDEAIAVAITHPDVKAVQVRIERCAFGPGKDVAQGGIALQVPPHANVDVKDSGFGPHMAAIQVAGSRDEGTELSSPATVKLTRSSFMFSAQGVAISALSPVSVTAGYCVFAQVGAESSSPSAILQAAKPDVVAFNGQSGQKNAYFQVNPLTIGAGTESKTYTFDDCRMDGLPVTDSSSVTLTQRPWAESKPSEVMANGSPWRAFRLKVESEPAVFLPKDRDPDVRVIGAQFYDQANNVHRAYADAGVRWPPPLPTLALAEPRQLVWDPSARDDPQSDIYSNLETLLSSARGGDTILIRHTGLLPLRKTVEIEKPRGNSTSPRLTFKPAEGSRPILTPDGEWAKLDQSLFRLLGGEVVFDGLQFLLKPSKPMNLQTVAAVTVLGGKGCAFKDCVFTLLEVDQAKSTVVQIADPVPVMAMEKDRPIPTPEIKFDRCVIRGRGRGVWIPVNSAAKVELNQSLTALDGPLFLAESSGKPSTNARSELKLTHVTAFVGGPLIGLKGTEKMGEMGTSGLVQTSVEANACLFAAVPGAGQPLVEVDGIDATEAMRILSWQVQKGNRYANFDATAAAMIVRPAGEGAMPKEWNWNQWIGEFAREPPVSGKLVGSVTFEKDPAGLRDLVSLRPADTIVKKMDFQDLNDKPGETGAEAKLPVPWPWDAE